jgi:hypothetical protein
VVDTTMHERRPAPARDAARPTPAAPAPDALPARLSSAGNAAFAGRTPPPRSLARTPVVEADLELQRAIAGTLAREGAPADPAAAPADPAARERADFLASCPRLIADHQPSTHVGRFDIRLEPPHMTLTVKVRFIPMGGRWDPDDLQVKLPAFQREWLQTASGFWRPGLFTFWSQRPGWEDVSVSVIPEFRIAEPGEKEHVLIEVTNTDDNHGREHHSAVDNRRHVADFGTNDNQVRQHEKGKRSTTAHEAGHLLGLGEEYVDGGVETTNVEASHSKLAQRQLGHPVHLGKTDSVMSSGGRLLPQHSVTMREALERAAAPFVEWGLTPAARRSTTPTSGPSPAPAASR